MQSMTQLPDNDKIFDIDIEEGEVTRQNYKGKFQCKCVLNLREKSEADVLQKGFSQGLTNLTEDTLVYHLIVAQLSARLTKAPDWWIAAGNGSDLEDLNVLYEVYQECLKAEREWKDQVWGAAEKKPEPVTEKKLESTSVEKEEGEDGEESDSQ